MRFISTAERGSATTQPGKTEVRASERIALYVLHRAFSKGSEVMASVIVKLR